MLSICMYVFVLSVLSNLSIYICVFVGQVCAFEWGRSQSRCRRSGCLGRLGMYQTVSAVYALFMWVRMCITWFLWLCQVTAAENKMAADRYANPTTTDAEGTTSLEICVYHTMLYLYLCFYFIYSRCFYSLWYVMHLQVSSGILRIPFP